MPKSQMTNSRRAASISQKKSNTGHRDNLMAATENFAYLVGTKYYLKANGIRTIILGVIELKKSFGRDRRVDSAQAMFFWIGRLFLIQKHTLILKMDIAWARPAPE
jgi:hypothetical protein